MSFKYACFVMTYKRPEQLRQTVTVLNNQELVPEVILIVDNDPEETAKEIALHLNCLYLPVGYNSGPAGGAAFGLRALFERGHEWVLWIDDDDPPVFYDTINQLASLVATSSSQRPIGVVGAVGEWFDRNAAKVKRIPDAQLKGVIEVDNVSGNMMPLVNRLVYEKGILPDSSLFFGFEDLDFCLAVKRGGFKVVISGEELYRHRQYYNRLKLSKSLYYPKELNRLWREYYTTRSLFNILFRRERAYLGTCFFFIRMLFKIIYGFRFGFQYGQKNFFFLSKGLFDGLTQKMGMRVSPVAKV
ncbi:MAG: glycosyltransferase [Bacteroidetes bacterium]|nr:glycosyltransferase [Bacteroidota bacterium]